MKKMTLAKILKRAEEISKAIELEAEEILEDTEAAVKETVPACNVTKVLKLIEEKLENEGVEALFQKNVSKIAIKRTASEGLSDKEIEELVETIVEAVVEEFEEILEDAEEVCNEDVKAFVEGEEDEVLVEGKLMSVLERKLAGKGIYAKLNRTAKVKAKTSTKIASSRNKVSSAKRAKAALENKRRNKR